MTTICGCGHSMVDHDHQRDFCTIESCHCHEFIADVEKWKAEIGRWEYEDAQDDKDDWEIFLQENDEREFRRQDNEEPSGTTDLGNRGGTTFCY
jgi:hypothetical protein